MRKRFLKITALIFVVALFFIAYKHTADVNATTGRCQVTYKESDGKTTTYYIDWGKPFGYGYPRGEYKKSDKGFMGWYTTDGQKIEMDDIVPQEESIELVQKWKKGYVSIRLSTNNGKYGGMSEIIYYAAKNKATSPAKPKANVGELPIPERAGYIFSYWALYSETTPIKDNQVVKDKYNSGNIIYLYANYDYAPITISFYDPTHKMENIASKTVYYNNAYGELPESTVTGYDVVWRTDIDSGSVVRENQTVLTPYDHTLYAYWSKSNVNIIYDGNDATSGYMSDSRVTYGSTLTLRQNTYTREFYRFDGWNTEPDGSGTRYEDGQKFVSFTETDKDMILYAQWIPTRDQCKIFYDGNGATSGFMDYSYCWKGESLFIKKNEFTRLHYKFVNWNTKPDGSGATFFENAPFGNLNENMTLYAQWEQDEFMLIYCDNSPEESYSPLQPESGKYYHIGDVLGSLKSLGNIPGYKFIGWSSKESGGTVLTSSTRVTANLLIESGDPFVIEAYAQWQPIQYTLRINYNNPLYPSKSINSLYSRIIDMTQYAKINTNGKTIIGWTINNRRYDANAKVSKLATVSGQTVTATAIWGTPTYTITYKPNGGQGTMSSSQVPYGGTLIIPTCTYTKEGYHCNSFSYSLDLTNKIYSVGSKMTVSSNMDLMAVWTPNQYTVKFYDGDLFLTSESVTFNSTYGTLPTPPANPDPNLAFAGWYTDKYCGEEVSADTILTNASDHNLYAHWIPVVITTYFEYYAYGEKYRYNYKVDFDNFFKSSYAYNHDLVKTSIRMAWAGYGNPTDATTSYGSDNIENLLYRIGVNKSDLYINYPMPTTDSIGYAIGHREIVDSVSGKKADLIIVVTRGGDYGDEWGGNFHMGETGDHAGFTIAANTVYNGLTAYCSNHTFNNPIKVWVCGYSRGAATANLLCAKIVDSGISTLSILPENVFGYCFECPNATTNTSSHDSRYNGIKCFINPIDPVPLVPPCTGTSNWNFDRYGELYETCSESNNPSSYDAYNNLMKQNYIDIFVKQGMSEQVAKEKVEEYTLINSFSGNTQEDYVKDTINSAANVIGKRSNYKLIESTLISAAKHYLGSNAKIDLEDDGGNIPFISFIRKNFYAHEPALCLAWIDTGIFPVKIS